MDHDDGDAERGEPLAVALQQPVPPDVAPRALQEVLRPRVALLQGGLQGGAGLQGEIRERLAAGTEGRLDLHGGQRGLYR